MTSHAIDAIPLWIVFVATALLLIGGNYVGYRLGLWRLSRRSEEDKAPTNAIMGSTLGLLAFLLAFTFGMSSTRFDTRRNLVLDEANAILRTHQRAQFLPEEQRIAANAILIEYADIRLALTDMMDLGELESGIRYSEELQDQLLALATSAQLSDANVSLFTRSLGELSELQMRRVRAVLWNRIPSTIETMLYVLAFLGMMTMGYNAGLAKTRPTLPTLVLVLAFSAVMVLIIDLGRPVQTLFEVSQEPMAAVRDRMADSPPN